ncbi:MAG: hypothetical protein AB8B50_00325 [Pirellulaceae bacterium]
MSRFALMPACIIAGLCSFCSSTVVAQICGPSYTVQRQTVMEEQLEERLRVVYDTVYEERDVVSQRPVLKTRYETRKYTVKRPVTETSTLEERYTVLKPVRRRDWVDRSYDETTYVTETAEREEAYTTYRPVTETTYQTQNYMVQRPVTETQYQTQQYTTYSPVTSYKTAVVDQGQYVAQQYHQPGDTRYGLRWLGSGYQADALGNLGYRRGGLGWVPYTSPGSTFAQMQYRPNPVQVAVPQTQMVPQVQQQQVPVQVTRMQSEMVQQQVPITQTRMEAVQATRRVPYTTQRPVTRRVENKEPVDRIEWVEQEMVRPKTVTRTSYKLETVEKEVPIQFYETESVTTTVRVPRRVPRYEAYTVRKLVPRTVQSPVVLSFYDPYSMPLSQGYSNWSTTTPTVAPAASESVTYGQAKPVVESPEPDAEEENESASGELPSQRLRKVETVEPAEVDGTSDGLNGDDGGLELNSSAGEEI